MLANYVKLSNGVIKQVDRKKYNYDFDYSNNYNKLGELGVRMAYLRLGHIIGSLGFIPNSIMDVGYGNGDFIKVCTNIIKNCYGSDVSPYPVPDGVQFISDRYSIDVDVVTFFDVLEHYEDIYEVINIKAKYMVISLPDCHYFSDEWFENWKHRKPDEHLWFFNRESLIAFMDEVGYKLVNICNIEDTIRTNNESYSNILTGVFVKKDL